MPTTALSPPVIKQYYVFLASPGDVPLERQYVRTFFDDFNRDTAQLWNVRFDVIDWENYSTIGVGRPQELITKQTLYRFHSALALVVGIMGQRLGTPTGKASSGTLEEFDWALESHAATGFPEIKWFFRISDQFVAPSDPTEVEEALIQWKRVLAFRARLRDVSNPVFVAEYRDASHFKEVFERDLRRWLSEPERPWRAPSATAASQVPPAQIHRRVLPNGSLSARTTPQPEQTTVKSIGPPSGWWAAPMGLFHYWRLGKLRATLFEHYTKHGLTKPLMTDFAVTFRVFDRELVEPTPGSIRIIAGPAGVGKSAYLDQLFRLWIGSTGAQPRCDLFARISTKDLVDAIGPSGESVLWSAIYRFFVSAAAATAQRTPSQSAIAYALKYRRILLVVEDLHDAGGSRETVELFERYFTTHHRWGSHVSILASTRESAEEIPELVSTTLLTPLSQRRAQEFFFELCKDNGLPSQALTEHGTVLGEAFGTESVRVPLFVVISASLAAHPSGQRLDVGHVLGMTSPALFDAFIKQLFKRSSLPTESYAHFREQYEDLALALRLRGNEFAYDAVARLLRASDGDEQVVTVEFLERNGFLRISSSLREQLAFPHQLMADYLAASAMVRRRDFTVLRQAMSATQNESVVAFIATLIPPADAPQILERLAEADPVSLVAVIETAATQKATAGLRPWTVPGSAVARGTARWLRSTPCGCPPIDMWGRLRDILDGSGEAKWRHELCALLNDCNPETATMVEAVATLAQDVGRALLLRWLADDIGARLFGEATRSPGVAAFVGRLVETAGLRTTLGFNAFAAAVMCQEPSARSKLIGVTIDQLRQLTDDDLRKLFALGNEATSVVGRAIERWSEPQRQKVSSVCAAQTGKALIPAGLYHVLNADGKGVDVAVVTPLLVPCTPVRAGRLTTKQVTKYIAADVGVRHLMSAEVALVAYQVFGHKTGPSPRYGVIVPEASQGVYEALLGPNGVALYYYYTDEYGAVMLKSAFERTPGDTADGQEVAYRSVETLH